MDTVEANRSMEEEIMLGWESKGMTIMDEILIRQ